MMSRRSTRIAQQQLKEESRKIDLQMFAREEGKRPSACSSDAGLSPSALDALGLSPGLRDRQSSSGSSEDQEELRNDALEKMRALEETIEDLEEEDGEVAESTMTVRSWRTPGARRIRRT